MRRILRRLAQERGQAIILFLIITSVTLVIGVITIDFGLWFSERRGAQKDADLSALAAAQELLPIVTLDDPNANAIQLAANDRATEYANLNDVTDPANILLPSLADSQAWTACWSDEGDTSRIIDTYPLDIKHPTRGLFGKIFSIADQSNLGAHARACVGSVISMENIMPIGVPIKNPDISDVRELCWAPDNDGDGAPEPLYGKRCDLSVTDKDSGEAGWLSLDNSSPLPNPPTDICSAHAGGLSDLTAEIRQGGANTTCYVAPAGFRIEDCTSSMNWCAFSQTGAHLNQIMGAFNTLFSTEGSCNVDSDPYDDFEGALELESGTPGTESAFYRKICDSPRLVTLIIIDNFNSKANPQIPIRAFATFFVEGCVADGVEYPKCDPHGNIGHFNLYGRFVNILAEGAVGRIVDWSPKRIILTE